MQERSRPSAITVVREEVTDCHRRASSPPVPLTSDALAEAIAQRLGVEALAFYDAIAPIVSADSLDHDVLFRASRYGKGGGDDYLNGPFDRGGVRGVHRRADRRRPVPARHEFDKVPYFEGCMPVEEMARRGRETLRFGPMKPVGLAIRAPAGSRTRWCSSARRIAPARCGTWSASRRACGSRAAARLPHDPRPRERRVPALRLDPSQLVHQLAGGATPHLSLRDDRTVFFAGQLTGVEGYTEAGDGADCRHQPRAACWR